MGKRSNASCERGGDTTSQKSARFDSSHLQENAMRVNGSDGAGKFLFKKSTNRRSFGSPVCLQNGIARG